MKISLLSLVVSSFVLAACSSESVNVSRNPAEFNNANTRTYLASSSENHTLGTCETYTEVNVTTNGPKATLTLETKITSTTGGMIACRITKMPDLRTYQMEPGNEGIIHHQGVSIWESSSVSPPKVVTRELKSARLTLHTDAPADSPNFDIMETDAHNVITQLFPTHYPVKK